MNDRHSIASIKAFLSGMGDDALILRNHDIQANLDAGGDVDLLVKDMTDARKQMGVHLGEPCWIIPRTYVEGCFYRWGHIDLTPRMEWHGAVYLPNQVLFKESEQSSYGFRKPRLAHEAVICWFASLIWGGFFKERYREIVLQAAELDGEAFEQTLNAAVGRRWGRELAGLAKEGRPEESVARVKKLRRALWWRAFARAPATTVKGWLGHWITEVRLRLNPPLPWVAILGPDGSGKSTVLAALEARWVAKQWKMKRYHWRPQLFRRGSGDIRPVTDPHGKPPRGRLISLAKLGFLLLDWTAGYWGMIANLRAKNSFVIFDRHYLDLLVDPLRYRYGAPLWPARLIASLIPMPDVIVVLDAPSEIVHARKQETTLEEARRQREAYLELARSRKGTHIVDCSQPVDMVVETIEKIIDNATRERSEPTRAAFR